MTTLYVIGNGFDRHHGMETSYQHFGEFLTLEHNELRELVDEYFPTDDDYFWAHFEEALATFDADRLVENSEHFIVPYSAEDWSDAYHHDYAFELDQVVKALSEDLRTSFTQWVCQIVIPSPIDLTVRRPRIDPAARFINFNYTRTLQQLYDVPDAHVWHIHGVAGGNEPLVLGHGWRPKPAETQSANLDPERADTRLVEGAEIIDEYFRKTFKPTARIIADNRAKFAGLGDVNDIRVLGHSLSDVDLPYLQTIAKSVSADAVWRISFRDKPTDLELQFAKISPAGNASFWSLPEV